MHLGHGNREYQYFMSDQLLMQSVKEEKDLGVQISHDMKPSRQCQLAYTKASRVLGMIRRTVSYKSRDVLLRLYKSLVRPHLEYCISAWSPYYSKDKQLLERVQHRFTRIDDGSWIEAVTLRSETAVPRSVASGGEAQPCRISLSV